MENTIGTSNVEFYSIHHTPPESFLPFRGQERTWVFLELKCHLLGVTLSHPKKKSNNSGAMKLLVDLLEETKTLQRGKPEYKAKTDDIARIITEAGRTGYSDNGKGTDVFEKAIGELSAMKKPQEERSVFSLITSDPLWFEIVKVGDILCTRPMADKQTPARDDIFKKPKSEFETRPDRRNMLGYDADKIIACSPFDARVGFYSGRGE
jgi:hypothetical protein